MEHITDLTFRRKETVAEYVQYLHLSNVGNAKCTYASKRVGIVSRSFIIEKRFH